MKPVSEPLEERYVEKLPSSYSSSAYSPPRIVQLGKARRLLRGDYHTARTDSSDFYSQSE